MSTFNNSDPPSKVTSFFTGSHGALEDEAIVLKDYVVGQRLGEGAYGSVYSIKHIASGETFALKILQKQDLFLNPGATSAFSEESSPLGNVGPSAMVRSYAEAFEKKIVQEAIVMQALQHPHVVNFYRFLNSKEAYYFIMELAEGGELFDLIISSHFFAENEARFYFQQLMSAIEYCHRNGVAHSDLKAENLLLGKDNRLLVCDFGFSSKNVKETVDDPEATLGTGDNVALVESLVNGFTGVGTLHYMSPEAIRAMTERTAPDVLLNLGYMPTSPIDRSSTEGASPFHPFDGVDSFSSPFNRRETSSFANSTVRDSHTSTAPASVSRRAPGSMGAASPPPPAVPHAISVPCGVTFASPDTGPALTHSPSKLTKTSYSTADLCSIDTHWKAPSHHASRSDKLGRHNSTRTAPIADRQHSGGSCGETVSSPKTVGDRWNSFVKTLIGHAHHERADSQSSLRHGLRKSRSAGSLCANESDVGSPVMAATTTTDRKKLEKDLKKKKKKAELGKTSSFGDCHSCDSLTHNGTDVAGSVSTPNTNTPELASPVRQPRTIVDPYQQDLWSAGIILFFMLTGRLPFDGRDDEETLHLIEQDEPSFGEEEKERISPAARELVLSMLAKEPTDRPTIDDIITSRWFATYLNLDALFEDRKDELSARLTKAGIVVDSQSAPSFYDLPVDKVHSRLEEQMIETAFQKIATDGYGTITRDELRDMMTTLHGDCVEKKDVSELIRLFTGDATSDEITYQQFRDAWLNKDIAHSPLLHNSEFQLANIVGIHMDDVERQLVRQLRAAFDSVNDDHDGMISASQLRRVLERFQCHSATDAELDSLIAYFDTRPSAVSRVGTNGSLDRTWSSPNPSMYSPVHSPNRPLTPAVAHEKGITFDAFVQGVVHKDILLRHPLGRRLAAATNLAALFQSHNVTECVRHGFLVSGLQNVILQKLTSTPERLQLLYTDETVSTTENIYSFRYLGSTAIVQGATIETIAPALASSTVFAMSASMTGFGTSHGGGGGIAGLPGSSGASRLSHSRRAPLALASSAAKASAWLSNGAALDTPVPSVLDFAQRTGTKKGRSTGPASSEAGSPNSAISSTFGPDLCRWPPPGTLSAKGASPTSAAPPLATYAPQDTTATAAPLSPPSTQTVSVAELSQSQSQSQSLPHSKSRGSQSQLAASSHNNHHHHHHHYHHHHRAHYQQRNLHRHSGSGGGGGPGSSHSQSFREAGPHPSCDDRHVSGTNTATVVSTFDLGSHDGESQISEGRNSNSIMATSESGEVSPRLISSCASLGRAPESLSPASASRGVTPSGSVKSPPDSPSPAYGLGAAPPSLKKKKKTPLESEDSGSPTSPSTLVTAPVTGRDRRTTAAPTPAKAPTSTTSASQASSLRHHPEHDACTVASSLPSPPLATHTAPSAGMGGTTPAARVTPGSVQTVRMGATPSYGDNLFLQDDGSQSGAAAHDFLSRSTGYSTSTAGHVNPSSVFPHRSLAFGASGAVPQVNGVCDADIILAPAFLGYTLVRFRRIHGKTNDFHEAVIYVSNLLDVERQQASEDTLPRGESELM